MTEPSTARASGAIERETCLDLLGAAVLARVVISVKSLPVALPARISLVDRDHILLASSDPAIARAANRSDVLSIQIDGIDVDGSTWSVMASGIAAAAPGDEPVSDLLRKSLDQGASLVTIPLSVVVGQHG
jgi:hypothetical protein